MVRKVAALYISKGPPWHETIRAQESSACWLHTEKAVQDRFFNPTDWRFTQLSTAMPFLITPCTTFPLAMTSP